MNGEVLHKLLNGASGVAGAVRRKRWLRRVGRAFGAAAAALGASGLLGWLLGVPWLIKPPSHPFAFEPLAALGVLLAGLAVAGPLGLRSRVGSAATMGLAATVIAFFLLRLAESAFGLEPVTSSLLPVSGPPGLRPGPPRLGAVASLLLLGATLIGFTYPSRRADRAAAALATTVAAVGAAVVIGYAYAAGASGPDNMLRGMSMYAALGVTLAAAGALMVRPDGTWVGALLADGPGAAVARSLLSILVPGVLGLGFAVSVLSRLVGLSFDIELTLFVLATLLLSALLVGRTARLVDLLDESRRASERELARSERRLEIAQEVAEAGSWEWNLDSGEIAWSMPLYRLYGVEPGVTPSLDLLRRLIHPDDYQHLGLEAASRGLGAGDRLTGEYRLRRPDGAQRWIATVGRVSVENGQRSLIGFDLDVTERREQEEALKAARQEAERATDMRSRFIATANHDLRQPVQSMMLYMGLLKGETGSPGFQMVVDGLEESVEAFSKLLDAMLEISRLDAGLVHFRRDAVDLGALLRRLATEYEADALRGGLALRLVPTRQWVESDPVMLERILRLILDNALRFTEHGRVLIGCRRRPGGLAIAIIDTGLGIPQAHHETIFEDFHQVGNPERDRSQGLGLGLGIARRLARLLGHRLAVRSAPGRGSVFCVEVPVTAPRSRLVPMPVEEAIEEAVGLPDDMVYSVAVVEDDGIVRSGVRTTLLKWGFEVVDGASGKEVAGKLAQSGLKPDVILADYRLRDGENGVDAVKTIRKACRFAIPGIILTGDTDAARLAEVERSGLPLLHKPVPPQVLRRRIEAEIAKTWPIG